MSRKQGRVEFCHNYLPQCNRPRPPGITTFNFLQKVGLNLPWNLVCGDKLEIVSQVAEKFSLNSLWPQLADDLQRYLHLYEIWYYILYYIVHIFLDLPRIAMCMWSLDKSALSTWGKCRRLLYSGKVSVKVSATMRYKKIETLRPSDMINDFLFSFSFMHFYLTVIRESLLNFIYLERCS